MGENFFSIIFYSFYILEGNYRELKKTIQNYLDYAATDEFMFDSHKQIEASMKWGREIARLIHNYTAAWYSLVEHTRIIQRKLKNCEEKELISFAIEYEEKLNESIKENFENLFVKDLRRYAQHKAVPVPSLQFKMRRINFAGLTSTPPQAEVGHSFELKATQIQDFDWSKASREYVESHQTIPIEEIFDRHFDLMKEFYLWIRFRDHQLHPYSSNSIEQSTFEDWKQQQNLV